MTAVSTGPSLRGIQVSWDQCGVEPLRLVMLSDKSERPIIERDSLT
jgi:hypothetical protein